MTEKQLQALSDTCVDEISALSDNSLYQVLITSFAMKLITFILSCPSFVIKFSPDILRIIANSLEIVINESDKKNNDKQ